MSKNRNHNTRETDEQVLKNSSTPEVAEETAEQTVSEAPSVQPETVNTDEAHENEGGTGEVADENAEGESGDTVTGDVSTETHEEKPAVPEQKPEEPEQETKENESAKTVEIVCDQLYLRPTPSKKESPLSILLKGQKLTVLEDGEKLPEGWIKVNASGSVGYVMSEYTR